MSHLQELILSSSSSLTCLHDLRTGSLLTSFKASSSGAGSQHGEISTLDGANGNGKGKGRANAGANANGADRSTSVYRRTVDVLEGADGQGGLVVAAVPGRGAINVWGFQKEAPIHRLLIPVKVSCLAISKNGLYLAVGAHDGRLLLWELSSGNLVASFDAHYRAVTCLAWTDDSAALVSGGDDAACHVWSLPVMLASPDNPLLPVAPYASLADHVLPLSSLSVSFGAFPSVRVLTASLDGTAKLWDLTLAAAGRALSAAAAAAADSANESGGQSRVKADHGAGSCLVSTFGFPPGAAVTHCALDQLERSFFAVYEDRRAQSTSSSSDGTSGSSSTSSSSGGGRCRLVKVDLYRRVRRGEAENDAGDGRDDGSDQQGEDDDDDEWEVVGGGGRGDIVRLREDGHVLSASAPAPSQTASDAPPATGTQSQRDADPRTARRSYSTASAAESIASLHLCALSSHLLVGLTSGRIDVLALPSLQCVRTLVPAVSSAAGSSLAHPITFLAALLRPTDLVSRTGGTRTTGTGAGAGAGAGGADEGVQPRYVAPQLGRNVVSASAHFSNQQGGVGDAGAGGVVNVRLTGSGAPALSMDPPSWSSLRDTRTSSLSTAAPARSLPLSRGADGQPASVSVSASSAALQEENARLREQLARSIKLNERMWEEMVDGALAEGKRASSGTSMQADRQ